MLHRKNPTPNAAWDPLYLHGLTLIPAWISNSIHYKVCGDIIYPFPFMEMGKLFHPKLQNGCNCLSMLGFDTIHVSKRCPWTASYGAFILRWDICDKKNICNQGFIAEGIIKVTLTHCNSQWGNRRKIDVSAKPYVHVPTPLCLCHHSGTVTWYQLYLQRKYSGWHALTTRSSMCILPTFVF